jgi:tetratricopeptide (TPR) repeat protein
MEPGRRASDAPTPPGGRRDLLLAALLLAAALIAYFPAHRGGLLLDDDLHITSPELQPVAGLWRIWFDVGATQQYYPVLHTAFWFEHRLWGDSVAGYHLANVLLHALAAVLVVVLMRRLRLPGAWLAAFLFALHPVCVESVGWISEQKNTLSTVLALGAAIAYLDFDLGRRPSRYWLALGLFALALLSKTVVLTLPAVLLVLAWWRRSRIDLRRDVWPLLPWFALGAVVSLVTFSVEHRLLAGIGADFALGPVERVLLAGRAFWFYLGELFWPVGLTFFYPKWAVSAAAVGQWLYPLSLAALAAGLWLLARRRRGPLAAFLCFAGTLAPILGFFNVEWFVFSYVADHLQYLSVLCVIIPVSTALATGAGRLPTKARWLAPAAGCALVALVGTMTWRQCARYRDPEVFYRTAAAMNPDSAAAHNHLGTVLAAIPGRVPEAITQFEEALRISPNAPEGEENLGTVLLKDPARRAEAAAHLENAIRLRPNRKTTHDKLAFVLSDIPGRQADAIAEYQASLRIDPADPVVHNYLGCALMLDPGRLGEAEAEFEAAVRLKADFAEAHNNLANAWRRMPGRLDDAISQYQEALRLKPDFAEAHNGLGLALAQTPGRLGDAIGEFKEALRLKPDFAEAHSNLGLAWTMMPGRLDDAVAELREALRLRPDFAPGWHVLGMVWFRAGNLQESAAAFREELRLSPGNPAAQEALDAVLRQAGGR